MRHPSSGDLIKTPWHRERSTGRTVELGNLRHPRPPSAAAAAREARNKPAAANTMPGGYGGIRENRAATASATEASRGSALLRQPDTASVANPTRHRSILGSVITMIHVDAPTSSNVWSLVCCGERHDSGGEEPGSRSSHDQARRRDRTCPRGQRDAPPSNADPEDHEAEGGDRAGGRAQREGVDLARGAGVEIHGNVAERAEAGQDTSDR